MRTSRSLALGLVLGIIHAGGLLLVAFRLGYSVGPASYSLFGVGWRYGGLVLVAGIPVCLALRFRVIGPLIAVVLTTGYVLGMELTPPGPTFHDVAEFEDVAGPTGITVVENGLYIVRYMVNASVWTLGFLLIGLVEYTVRHTRDLLPAAGSPPRWARIPHSRNRAMVVGTAGGLFHAVVMLWYATRVGISAPGEPEWVWFIYITTGMWLLLAVPLYLLVRYRLVLPVTLSAFFVLLDVQAAFSTRVDGPHALYVGAWVLLLALILVGAGVEYGLRRVKAHGWVAWS